MAQQGEPGNTLSSVANALRLARFVEREGPVTVSDVADALDMPSSTAHVYLKTLTEEDYLLNEDGAYRASMKFLEHGGRVRHESKIYHAARRELDKLAAETGEVANLGIEERGERVLLYKSEGEEGIYDNPPVGQYTKLHWTALGKALLSQLPRERVEEIVAEHGLPAATEKTITSEDRLYDALDETAANGYSIEDEERRRGIRAIGVPILESGTGDVVGAISISGPKNRIDPSDDDLVEPLLNSSNVIQLRYSHY